MNKLLFIFVLVCSNNTSG